MSARVVTMSREAIEAYAPSPGDVIISITDRAGTWARLAPGFNAKLYVPFDLCGDGALDDLQAIEIARFATRHHETADQIIVQCGEGRVRSRAVAMAIAYELSLRCETTPGRFYEEDRAVYLRVRDAFRKVPRAEQPDDQGDASRVVLGQGAL